MSSSITVNGTSQLYLRTARRVYDYLTEVVNSKSEYDLQSSFRTGGDSFLSLRTLTKSGPNIFEILLSRLLDVEDYGDDVEVGTIELDYNFDKRSANTATDKVKLKSQAKDPSKLTKRDMEVLFMPKMFNDVSEEEKTQAMQSYAALIKRVNTLEALKQDEINFIPKKTAPLNINNKTYFDLVTYLFYVIMIIEELEQEKTVHIDWNSEEYISSPFTIHELKLCLNFMGVSCMGVTDINKETGSKVTLRSNQVWLILFLDLLGTIAYQLPLSVVPMFMQAIYGETAIYSNAFAYCFSFFQLFGVVILHRASEKIGRKPVYILVFAMYALTNIASGLLVTGNVAKIAGISITDFSAVGQATCAAQLVIRCIQGFFGLVAPMAITFLTDLAAPSIKAQAFNLATGLEIASAMVAFLFVAFGVNNIAYALKTPETKENSVIFCTFLAAGIHLLCLLIVVFALKESSAPLNAYRAGLKLGIKIERQENESTRIHSTKEVFRTFCMNKNLIFLFMSYIFIIGNTQGSTVATGTISQNYLNRHITTLLLNSSIVNMLSCAVGVVLIYIYLLPLVKKIGEKKTIVIVFSTTVAFIIYMAFPPPFDVYIWGVLGGLLSIGAVLTGGCVMTLTAAETTPQNRASISGIMQVANSIGRVIAPLIWSAWMDRNMRDALFGNIILVGLGLIFVAFIGKVTETPDVIRMKKEEAKRLNAQAEVVVHKA